MPISRRACIGETIRAAFGYLDPVDAD